MITLLSDFCLLGPYVGILKEIIEDIPPKVNVIDLTHLIPPRIIRAAAQEEKASVSSMAARHSY